MAGRILWIRPAQQELPALAAGWQLQQLVASEAILQLPPADLLIVDIATDSEVRALAGAYPHAVRLLTVPDCHDELLLPHLPHFHLFYPEPLADSTLPAIVTCLAALQALDLPAPVQQQLLQYTHLPLVPPVLQQLQQLLQDPDVRIELLADVLAQDPVLTAKLLRLANSAYMGFAQETTSLSMAISRLGLNLLEGMLLALTAMPVSQDNAGGQACLLRADLSRRLALALQLGQPQQEQAYLAALFDGLGQWLLSQMTAPNSVTPAQAGAFMLTLWGFGGELAAVLLAMPTPPTALQSLPAYWQEQPSVPVCVWLTEWLLTATPDSETPALPASWQLESLWPALRQQYGASAAVGSHADD